jgi:hypothetical protein
MDKLKAIEELAEKWIRENSLTAYVSGPPLGEIKAFMGGFHEAMELSKDAWDSGYQAGKAYGEAMAEGKKA